MRCTKRGCNARLVKETNEIFGGEHLDDPMTDKQCEKKKLKSSCKWKVENIITRPITILREELEIECSIPSKDIKHMSNAIYKKRMRSTCWCEFPSIAMTRAFRPKLSKAFVVRHWMLFKFIVLLHLRHSFGQIIAFSQLMELSEHPLLRVTDE